MLARRDAAQLAVAACGGESAPRKRDSDGRIAAPNNIDAFQPGSNDQNKTPPYAGFSVPNNLKHFCSLQNGKAGS